MKLLEARGLVRIPDGYDGYLPKLEAKPPEGKVFSLAHNVGSDRLVPRFSLPADRVQQRGWEAGARSFTGQLKPYQTTAVQQSLVVLCQSGGMLLRADCGTGKTVMSLAILQQLGVKRAIVLVDQANIADQWVERIKQFLGEDAVIFSGDGESIEEAYASTANIKVIMAQSLMRQDWAEDPIVTDLLIVDEAHVFSAPIFSGAMKNIDFAFSIGLTATPDRKDKLEWVFQDILGNKTVHVEAKARTAKVRGVFLDCLPDMASEDYEMFWCRKNRKSSWRAKCTECPLFDKFPNCGWMSSLSKERINLAAMVSALANDPEYNKWILDSCMNLLNSGRHILVFSQLRAHLKTLHKDAVSRFGDSNCGIYLGVQVKDDEVRRAVAMDRRLTFCTFGVANKALDVPHKDTAIFATPKSDVRQAKGRIEREFFDKKDPLIVDPVLQHVNMFKYMWFARRRIYNAAGCEITTVEI
jgi:superfamily II DNA or RNA helicase